MQRHLRIYSFIWMDSGWIWGTGRIITMFCPHRRLRTQGSPAGNAMPSANAPCTVPANPG